MLLKKPIVISTLGMLEPWSFQQKFYKKKFAFYLYQKYFLESAKIIHCTSSDEVKNLKNLGIKNRIELIPHGLSSENISIKHKKYKKKKILLFISRILKKKGIFNLIDAFKSINNKHWYLFIVGFGEPKDVTLLQSKIKNQKKIKFFGKANHNQKNFYYKKANITILPSYNENFGYVIAESFFNGTPVATTLNTPWKFIEKKNIGYIIGTETKELISKLQFIFSSSLNDQKKRGLNGYKYVSKYYNLNKIYYKYLKLYRSVLAKN
jgi:glycosyltransferase involved in cell wall biosynthesis